MWRSNLNKFTQTNYIKINFFEEILKLNYKLINSTEK